MSFELAVDSGIQEVTIVGIRETSADIMEVEQTYQMMGMEKSISTLEMPYTTAAAFGVPLDAFSSVAITVYDPEEAAGVASSAVRLLDLSLIHI